jgi:hypothetical protein
MTLVAPKTCRWTCDERNATSTSHALGVASMAPAAELLSCRRADHADPF